jgi:hypothetical protein
LLVLIEVSAGALFMLRLEAVFKREAARLTGLVGSQGGLPPPKSKEHEREVSDDVTDR